MGMGSNPSEVVFSGNEDNYRGFIEVPPIKKVTFQNFTIRQMFSNGDDNRGGAAIAYRRNNSDLLIDNMRFINNSVHQSSYHSGGGAIYIEREILRRHREHKN